MMSLTDDMQHNKAENIQPEDTKPAATGQDTPEQWQPLTPEDKKKYDREFLICFQFRSAATNKPEGLPVISDVVLNKAKAPQRQLVPSRGPEFKPSYANLGRPAMGGGGGPGSYLLEKCVGQSGRPRRTQRGQRKEPRKMTTTASLTDDVQLKKPEKQGDLFTEAADAAMEAMKGRLANQYYMKAEEAWALVEEEE